MEQIRISVNKDSPKTRIYYIFVHIFRLQESFLEAKILPKAIKLHFCTSEQKNVIKIPHLKFQDGQSKKMRARRYGRSETREIRIRCVLCTSTAERYGRAAPREIRIRR